MSMDVFALALVVSQCVPGSEGVFNGNFKHQFGFLRFWPLPQYRLGVMLVNLIVPWSFGATGRRAMITAISCGHCTATPWQNELVATGTQLGALRNLSNKGVPCAVPCSNLLQRRRQRTRSYSSLIWL